MCQNLAINAAKAIGCQVVNVGASDLIEGQPVLILGLVWQIVRIALMANVSLTAHPELVRARARMLTRVCSSRYLRSPVVMIDCTPGHPMDCRCGCCWTAKRSQT